MATYVSHPRDQLDEQQMKQALDACAREPIHIPGSIQPHGMLLACNSQGIIEQISMNAEAFLEVKPEDCLGRNFAEFVGNKQIAALAHIKNEGVLQPIQSAVMHIKGQQFDAVSHAVPGGYIIELEPLSEENASTAHVYNDGLRNFAIGMHKAKTTDMIFEHVTRSIRAITGFDRVKLYRFDQDWHGEVVAESRADFMPSYKGLHFPASDIPEQARKLYTQNYLRLIANIDYKPVPLLSVAAPDTGNPLDLSLSMLRSVSPVHIQYLDNINVKASMSVSIIQNGKLWGLIACHHNSPHYIPYAVRHVCEIMGHIFSAQLSTLEEYAKRDAQDKRDQLIKQFVASLDKNVRIEQLMENTHALAMQALEADGMVVKAYVHVLEYGERPPAAMLTRLLDWLNEREYETVFHTEDAAKTFKNVSGLEGLTGGILAVPISARSHDYIIWFRSAMVEEVEWAGNPEKPAEQTIGGYRLTPRSSFELWKQTVQHRSKAWLPEDISTARSIVSVLLESEKISAQQANIAKTEFLANMSHEIRTPMNAVIGLTNILANSSPLTERQQQYIKTLQISADGLLSLINDLLDVSKIESRNLELESIPFDLGSLLQEVISMMSVKANEKKIAFHLEQTAVDGITFMGDPSRIRQIILNLCSNALKFTHEGRIDLIVHREEIADSEKDKICVIVRDTGIGIPSDKLETIFHKFVQADNSISRQYGGTGLGLSITKMLAEAMGGEISVTSELGKGSEFTVCFYLAKNAEVQHAVKTSGDRKQASTQHKVLLVEDYEPNILVATIYLDELGYAYDIARSGPEAAEKANENEYYAILMDVQMPGMTGFQVTQIIRELEQAKNKRRVPIIGMTAHALAGDRERCLSAGMDDYIAKPVDMDELEGKLKLRAA